MKIRNGFVSNSSSSSFVCNYFESEYNIKYNKKEITKKLKIMYKFAIDIGLFKHYGFIPSFNEVFGKIRLATKEDIKEFNEGWDKDFKYSENMFLINSAKDNSIPCELFTVIESIFQAERVHLG